MENPETPKRPFVRKSVVVGAIIGALAGASLTITALILNSTSDSHDYGPAMLLGLISTPSVPLLMFLGLFGLKFINMNPTVAFPYLVSVDAISYCLIGAIIGWFIQQFKKKS
jgi:hypothetical protein